MKRLQSWLGLGLILVLVSCNATWIPLLWKTYEHPTYKFSFKHPRSWKVEESGTFGALLTILPPEDDALFQANANIVVEVQEKDVSLKTLADRSQLQLGKILQDYVPLATASAKLGNADALELRGKYKASEGDRVIRTWIAYRSGLVYILTFTCRAELENEHVATLDALLRSMLIPTA